MIGIKKLSFTDEGRAFEGEPRLLETVVWYPAAKDAHAEKISHKIWKVRNAAKDASIEAKDTKLPLILFSHGYGGNPYSNSWFAEYLAERGYIVASVKHCGNSHPGMIPELSFRPWHRPQDISFVLDQLLEHPDFAKYIDTKKIGIAGFSQGGITALWLAGMRAHLTKENVHEQFSFIHDKVLNEILYKDIPKKQLETLLDNFVAQDFEQANKSYRDPRIKAAFAMAPGIAVHNLMFIQEDVFQIEIPIYLVAGETDDVVHVEENAHFFFQHSKQSSFTLLPGRVTHWTFLNEGTKEGRETDPYLVIDHPSVDRYQIHQHVGTLAHEFFQKYFG